MGLGSCCIGAFDDEKVKAGLPVGYDPLYLVSVGRQA
jgi:nitroreductase